MRTNKVFISFTSPAQDKEGYYYKGRLRMEEVVAKEFLNTIEQRHYKIEGNIAFLTLTAMHHFRVYAENKRLDVEHKRMQKKENYYIYVEEQQKPNTQGKKRVATDEALENIYVSEKHTGMEYLHGRCDHYAVALSNVLAKQGINNKIITLLEPAEEGEDELVHLHTFVQAKIRGVNWCMDIKGVHPNKQEMLDEGGFDYGEVHSEVEYKKTYNKLLRGGFITEINQQEQVVIEDFIANYWLLKPEFKE